MGNADETLVQRVYDRVQTAQYERRDHVEITRAEAMAFRRMEADGERDTEMRMLLAGLDYARKPIDQTPIRVGDDALIIGFPCVIVDKLTSPAELTAAYLRDKLPGFQISVGLPLSPDAGAMNEGDN